MLVNLSKFIIKDPSICHGEPTFRGTRILVRDVLDQVANGMDWNNIIKEWHGAISKDAITEAVRLAKDAFINNKYNSASEISDL